MTLLKSTNNPTSTSRLLDKLDSIIKEAQLVRNIINLDDQHRVIAQKPEQAQQARDIRRKITKLENQLNNLRSLAT